ncbi:MAG: RNA pseudouridine synthase [Planctomycetes bacterium]|nr:RNA pseudouridine synthase [Planctomycetota bacterium]
MRSGALALTMAGDPESIRVLFEDERVLVVDKPPRMLVVDAPGRSGPTLIDLLSKQLGEPVYPVHRLDEDTTGALLVARSPESRARLDELLRHRLVERVYHARTARVPSPLAGRIESRLEEGRDGVVRCVRGRRGKTAITNYRVLERRAVGALVECRLETGRRNQIRAHLAELGCPIIGDRKYGWRATDGGPKPSRPLLHAFSLAFDDPESGRRVFVESPAPEPELRLEPSN